MSDPDHTLKIVTAALADLKGIEVEVLDVAKLTTITDAMVIVSGRSSRHVKSLADAVLTQAKAAGVEVIGSEGEQEGDWILIDLAYVIVHIMQPRTRDFYKLEKLWGMHDRDEQAGRST
ncbi:MAG: ribosome silencing factor [Gammaproteobacteria bacterium]|nr:ribosome silencing factor [Gammaproteobacteria bacterium]